jgi:hypothetical protein
MPHHMRPSQDDVLIDAETAQLACQQGTRRTLAPAAQQHLTQLTYTGSTCRVYGVKVTFFVKQRFPSPAEGLVAAAGGAHGRRAPCGARARRHRAAALRGPSRARAPDGLRVEGALPHGVLHANTQRVLVWLLNRHHAEKEMQ